MDIGLRIKEPIEALELGETYKGFEIDTRGAGTSRQTVVKKNGDVLFSTGGIDFESAKSWIDSYIADEGQPGNGNGNGGNGNGGKIPPSKFEEMKKKIRQLMTANEKLRKAADLFREKYKKQVEELRTLEEENGLPTPPPQIPEPPSPPRKIEPQPIQPPKEGGSEQPPPSPPRKIEPQPVQPPGEGWREQPPPTPPSPTPTPRPSLPGGGGGGSRPVRLTGGRRSISAIDDFVYKGYDVLFEGSGTSRQTVIEKDGQTIAERGGVDANWARGKIDEIVGEDVEPPKNGSDDYVVPDDVEQMMKMLDTLKKRHVELKNKLEKVKSIYEDMNKVIAELKGEERDTSPPSLPVEPRPKPRPPRLGPGGKPPGRVRLMGLGAIGGFLDKLKDMGEEAVSTGKDIVESAKKTVKNASSSAAPDDVAKEAIKSARKKAQAKIKFHQKKLDYLQKKVSSLPPGARPPGLKSAIEEHNKAIKAARATMDKVGEEIKGKVDEEKRKEREKQKDKKEGKEKGRRVGEGRVPSVPKEIIRKVGKAKELGYRDRYNVNGAKEAIQKGLRGQIHPYIAVKRARRFIAKLGSSSLPDTLPSPGEPAPSNGSSGAVSERIPDRVRRNLLPGARGGESQMLGLGQFGPGVLPPLLRKMMSGGKSGSDKGKDQYKGYKVKISDISDSMMYRSDLKMDIIKDGKVAKTFRDDSKQALIEKARNYIDRGADSAPPEIGERQLEQPQRAGSSIISQRYGKVGYLVAEVNNYIENILKRGEYNPDNLDEAVKKLSFAEGKLKKTYDKAKPKPKPKPPEEEKKLPEGETREAKYKGYRLVLANYSGGFLYDADYKIDIYSPEGELVKTIRGDNINNMGRKARGLVNRREREEQEPEPEPEPEYTIDVTGSGYDRQTRVLDSDGQIVREFRGAAVERAKRWIEEEAGGTVAGIRGISKRNVASIGLEVI